MQDPAKEPGRGMGNPEGRAMLRGSRNIRGAMGLEGLLAAFAYSQNSESASDPIEK